MKTLEAPVHRSVQSTKAYWYLTNRFVVLADGVETGNEYGLVHGLIDPAGTPPAHVHNREDEVFYIIRGEGKILVGDQEFHGSAGDLFYLPRGIAHMPIATSNEVEVLILAAPADFLGYFREFMTLATHEGQPDRNELTVPPLEDFLHAGHKYGITFLPPAASVASWPIPEIHAEPLHVTAGSGERFSVLGNRVSVKLDGNATQSMFSIFEAEHLPGGGMPANIHRLDSEAFYVLSGEYELMVEWMTERVEPGTFVFVPPGVVRGYQNVGGRVGKMLQITSRSGHEEFYREVNSTPGVDQVRFSQIARKHGIDIVG